MKSHSDIMMKLICSSREASPAAIFLAALSGMCAAEGDAEGNAECIVRRALEVTDECLRLACGVEPEGGE